VACRKSLGQKWEKGGKGWRQMTLERKLDLHSFLVQNSKSIILQRMWRGWRGQCSGYTRRTHSSGLPMRFVHYNTALGYSCIRYNKKLCPQIGNLRGALFAEVPQI
jgi:hypothetical protein